MKLLYWRKLVLVVLFIALIPFPLMTTFAEECTGEELDSVWDVLYREEGVFDEFDALYSALQSSTTVEETAAVFESINTLQMRWWGEVEPGLSQCARQTVEIVMFGRLIDEALIYSSMTQTMQLMTMQPDFSFEDETFLQYVQLTHDHGRQVTTFRQNLMPVQANGADFAACVAGDVARVPQCFHYLLEP